MTKSFTERKLKWLEDLATDPSLPPLSVRIAVLLATRYLNSQSHKAWPSTMRLADELGADRRSVQRALDRLVDAGWLSCVEPRGRGSTNVYRMRAVRKPPSNNYNSSATNNYNGAEKGVAQDAFCGAKRRRWDPQKAALTPPPGRHASTLKGGADAAPNPRENPRGNPLTNAETELRAAYKKSFVSPSASIDSRARKSRAARSAPHLAGEAAATSISRQAHSQSPGKGILGLLLGLPLSLFFLPPNGTCPPEIIRNGFIIILIVPLPFDGLAPRKLRTGLAISGTAHMRTIRRSAFGMISTSMSRSRPRSSTCTICSSRSVSTFRSPTSKAGAT